MTDINSIKGIGPERAKDLAKRGIKTAEELVRYLPRGYEDRTRFSEIADCPVGEFVCIKARIYSPVRETRIKKGFSLYKAVIFDDSGAMDVVWYNNRYVKNSFRSGEEWFFFGAAAKNGLKKELRAPIYEREMKYIGRIVPIYPLSGKLTQKIIAGAVEAAIEQCGAQAESLPMKIREEYNIAEINFALKNIHFPKDYESYNLSRRRFVFEELLTLQLALSGKRRVENAKRRNPFSDVSCVSDFTSALPFEPTNAQMRVINELCEDFLKPNPMNRLIQGDVGSGKTAVAAAGVYIAVKNGCQAAVMAPTEILAFQHFESFSKMLKGMRIALLTSSTKNSEICKKIQSGDYDLVIGTNAIIQNKVSYKNLGLVIVDEQHRFGVAQRAELTAKGEAPHTIIMTATPIPRTLSLILYGDLEISVIDELPPGRKPVATYCVGENMRKRVYAFLDKHIKDGSQAYVVCPLVEESEKSDLADAVGYFERLKQVFPDYCVGLIHGRMNPNEKESVMREFADGKINILVSTTVIEVGVNVPNSNVMIIENAERFGLSTLHQLRGRVGRGRKEAFCIMFANVGNEVTKKRMKTMCESNDGFYIAEQDLKFRGPGDFFGTRQHGLPELRVANLFSDGEILKEAQKCAADIFSGKYETNGSEFELLLKNAEKLLPETVILN